FFFSLFYQIRELFNRLKIYLALFFLNISQGNFYPQTKSCLWDVWLTVKDFVKIIEVDISRTVRARDLKFEMKVTCR
ncbi:hypothetical protein WDU94_011724, partial [Cyamophila willieti]